MFGNEPLISHASLLNLCPFALDSVRLTWNDPNSFSKEGAPMIVIATHNPATAAVGQLVAC